MISCMTVFVPKYVEPTLAAMKKKIDTDKMDIKIKIQDFVSNNFKRFQVGAALAGNFEYQFSGR